MKNFSLLFILLLAVGCTTMKQRKSLHTMTVSALVGGLVASSLAPKGDNKSAHAMLGAATGTAAGGLYSLYAYGDTEEIKKYKKERIELVEKIQKLTNDNIKGVVSYGHHNFFKRKPPKEFINCVKPGFWEIIKEKELSDDEYESDKVFIRHGKKFRIVPPELKSC